MKKENLIGKRFGKLKVIKEGPLKLVGKKNPKNRGTWICKCDCGQELCVLTSNLRNKTKGTKSCGCSFVHSKKYNFSDLTGKRFGYLLVEKLLPEKTKTRGCYWLCKCDCGNSIKLPTNSLTSGNYVTCGDKSKHYKNKLDPQYFFYKEIPLSHYNQIKSSAVKRELLFDVDIEYLYEIYLKQNKKCALSGIDLFFTTNRNASKTRSLTTASLDRVDNSKGYIKDNVRWVHKDLNKMRLNHTDEDFIKYCKSCVQNYYFRNRPNWDIYFLNLAINISYRSEDPNVKHGSVIVNEKNHICGTGYNGLIKGAKNIIDLNNRDVKRLHMIHSEENAILNCSKNGNYFKIYVTAEPCLNCLQRIINFDIKEIIYIDRLGSITENEETKKYKNNILNQSKIIIKKYKTDDLLILQTSL